MTTARVMDRVRALVVHETQPLWLLLALGATIRLLVMLGTNGIYWPDSTVYYHGAIKVLNSGIFTHQAIYRTPFYPIFISFFLHFGQTPAIGLVFIAAQHLLGLASVLLIYRSTRMVFGPWVALWTALLMNVHALLLYYENVILTETLFVFLLSVAIYLVLRAMETRSLWRWGTLGVVLGLLALTRPLGLLLLPALLPAIWWKYGEVRRTLLHAGLAGVVFFLTLLPWMLTNLRVYGYFGVARLQGVQLFHKAADKARMDFPATTRQPGVDRAARVMRIRSGESRARIDWQVYGRIQKMEKIGPLKADQAMFAYALEMIRQQPGKFIRQTLDDFWRFYWDAKPSITLKRAATGPYLSYPHALKLESPAFPADPVVRFPLLRRFLAGGFTHLTLPIQPLFCLGVAGALLFFRRGRLRMAEGFLFLTVPIYLGFFTTFFETYQDRYRLPADPFIFAFAGFALGVIVRCARRAWEPEVAAGRPEPAAAARPDVSVTPGSPDISVVILCYKAQEFVPTFVAQVKEVLDRNSLTSELVLVANYRIEDRDSDRTPEIVREMAARDPSIKVIAREKQGMMGWDMQSGLAAADARTVAIIDGDGQMPPEDIIRVYDLLKEGDYDMAKTYRVQRCDGWMRVVITRVYNGLLRVLFPEVRVHDANSKPRIFRHDALRKIELTADDWFIDAEIVIQASYLGLRIGEVPTVFRANEYRGSFVRPAAIFEFIRNLIVYRLRHLRGFGR